MVIQSIQFLLRCNLIQKNMEGLLWVLEAVQVSESILPLWYLLSLLKAVSINL